MKRPFSKEEMVNTNMEKLSIADEEIVSDSCNERLLRPTEMASILKSQRTTNLAICLWVHTEKNLNTRS